METHTHAHTEKKQLCGWFTLISLQSQICCYSLSLLVTSRSIKGKRVSIMWVWVRMQMNSVKLVEQHFARTKCFLGEVQCQPRRHVLTADRTSIVCSLSQTQSIKQVRKLRNRLPKQGSAGQTWMKIMGEIEKSINRQMDRQTSMTACANHVTFTFQQKRQCKKRFNSMLIHHCDFHALTLLQKRHWILNWYCMLARIINLTVWSEMTLQFSCHLWFVQTHTGGCPVLGERYWWSWAEEMRCVLALTICQSHATDVSLCAYQRRQMQPVQLWWSYMASCVATPGLSCHLLFYYNCYLMEHDENSDSLKSCVGGKIWSTTQPIL